MKIEKDSVEIWCGLRGNTTPGNPITMVIFIKIMIIGKKLQVRTKG